MKARILSFFVQYQFNMNANTQNETLRYFENRNYRIVVHVLVNSMRDPLTQ